MAQDTQESRKHVFTLIVAVAILLALAMYLFFFQVRQAEVVVKSVFGKPVAEYKEAGLYVKWPYPINEITRFDSRLQVYDSDLHETLTKDERNLIVGETVGWRITDAKLFVQAQGTVEKAVQWLKPLSSDAKTKVIGQYLFRNFVSTDHKDLKHSEIEEAIKNLINQSLAHQATKYGIEVQIVKLKRIELPQAVTAKVFERMKQERNRESQKIRAEGEGISQSIKSKAEAARDAILAMADSDARAIRGQGDAEAAKYYEALNNRPELALFLRKVEALDKVADKLTLIIDPTIPPFDILNEKAVMGEAKTPAKADAK
ncbi:MAG TPA: protease modulator HflC [Candidatus Brocadiia bacterium]|nr:protease modulator HflC [Candidatus Brocadiia bacterium]